MSESSLVRSLSSFTLDSQPEDDWDATLIDPESNSVAVSVDAQPNPTTSPDAHLINTPRNSVIFPAEDTPSKSSRYSSTEEFRERVISGGNAVKRTLSELLRLHSEKGSKGKFTQEEALRIADVLGEWINAASSPYEGEDDFFQRPQAQDDISVASKRPIPVRLALSNSRPRGRSESANSVSTNTSRPPSSAGFVHS